MCILLITIISGRYDDSKTKLFKKCEPIQNLSSYFDMSSSSSAYINDTTISSYNSKSTKGGKNTKSKSNNSTYNNQKKDDKQGRQCKRGEKSAWHTCGVHNNVTELCLECPNKHQC